MSEHVPTTDEIRDDYAHMIAPHTTWGEDGFERWLDQVRADARREGQADAWDEGWVSRHNYDERGGEASTPNPYEEDRHVDQ